MSNTLKTTLLLGLLTGIILWIGGFLGGSQGLVVAFVFATIMNFGSYWFSDKIVLAMYGARPVGLNEAPDLYRIVQNLATRAQMPMPKLYVIPSDAANAFATGRNPEHAAVAVTEGIMRLMSWDELEGVLAHEISHVRNRDILLSSIAATLAGVIMMLANMVRWAAIFGGVSRDERNEGGGLVGLVVMSILAPLAATLIQLAISRSREYQADASGAALLHSGESLAKALEKLESAAQRVPLDASPQTAHLFIVNPLSGRSFANLFSTHPPLEERIRRLRSMRV
ncbi:MAG: endopeptidase htpX [Deltaproteobacteria bacterium]|nr:endopeptidase htpX [Deltaproteobacteria bacterium]